MAAKEKKTVMPSLEDESPSEEEIFSSSASPPSHPQYMLQVDVEANLDQLVYVGRSPLTPTEEQYSPTAPALGTPASMLFQAAAASKAAAAAPAAVAAKANTGFLQPLAKKRKRPQAGADSEDWVNCQEEAGCARAETDIGQCYGGFISAKVTSIVPGTLVQSQKTDPDLTTSAEEEDDQPAAPPSLVIAKNGDVICKFTSRSFNVAATKHEVFFRMMRPVLSENVAMLRARGLMWNSLQTTGTLSEVIYDWDRALLQLGEPDLTGAHLPRSLHVLPSAQTGTPMVACARGLTAVAGSRSCGGVGVRVITPEFRVIRVITLELLPML